jgi:hypothetical protein
MGRWSPTVVAEAPRGGGSMALAAGLETGINRFEQLQQLREQRRQQAEAESQGRQRLDIQRADGAREDARNAAYAEDLAERRRMEMQRIRAQLIGDGYTDEEPGPTQAPGEARNLAEAGQEESETQAIMRRASEAFPPNVVATQGPDGRTYRMDVNRKARDAAIQKALGEIEERKTSGLKHTQALELQDRRNKGAMERAKLTASQRAARGGGGARAGGGGSDGSVTPTQARGALMGAQKGVASMMKRNALLDRDDDDKNNMALRDSIATVQMYDPDSNPAMAAGVQQYGMPKALQPFYPGTAPQQPAAPRGEVDTQDFAARMGELTRKRDMAKDPQTRAAAQRLMNELAQAANTKKLR